MKLIKSIVRSDKVDEVKDALGVCAAGNIRTGCT